MVFFCLSISVVLFDAPEISKCLSTLFLSSLCLCFITGFICDLFVARGGPWMSWKSRRVYVFAAVEAVDEDWDPVQLAGAPSNFPVSILRKSISGRHRPVRVADGPMTARCRFT